MTEAASDSRSLAAQAVTLAKAGKLGEAATVLVNLSREELAGAVAELARMAIARDAEVFPQGDKDRPELAPDWPAFWAAVVIEARKADDDEWLASLMTANRPGSANESMCLRVLLAAAVGAEAEASS
jgi:hypothetical protein